MPSISESLDHDYVLSNCSTQVNEKHLSNLSGLKLNEANPNSGILLDNQTKEVTMHNIEIIQAEKSFMIEVDNQLQSSQQLHEIMRMKLIALY